MAEILMTYAPHRFSNIHPEDFETLIKTLFADSGYSVEQTPYVGDFGADVIAIRGSDRFAIQVKRYNFSSKVGVGDVNQVIGAMKYYGCTRALVITTSGFTASAIDLAARARVNLWDWSKLKQNLEKVYRLTLR
ncbi:MAG: restriction endonuclease [Pirellula sp.]|nr:restriction endonuclease [Pirellula sp.]